jgi:5-(carboxyamino)imidazole ribonucleotide mutase
MSLSSSSSEPSFLTTGKQPLVAIAMGSSSDWPVLRYAHELLERFEVPHQVRVLSAHRTPEAMATFAKQAEAQGLQLIIAGAGGAAHLPGMLAAYTTLPVLGVPIESAVLKGVDSLYSIVQMPAGVPVATLAIGVAGAKNAALLAIAILALNHVALSKALQRFRSAQQEQVEQQQASLQAELLKASFVC